MDKSGEDAAVAEVVSRLVAQHPEIAADQIREAVLAEHARFTSAAVRDFVPLLVERRLIERYGRRNVNA